MLNLNWLVGVLTLGLLETSGNGLEPARLKEQKSVVRELAIIAEAAGRPTRALGRQDSRPFISGDTFRTACQHAYDNLAPVFYPTQVQRGDLVFVKTDFLADFLTRYHPLINQPYILVTHNSDDSSPGQFAKYLEDPKLAHWFGTNPDLVHPKFTALPVGLANRYCKHGNITNLLLLQRKLPTIVKKQLLCMNFVLRTNLGERERVFNLFKDQPYCKTFIDQHEVGVKSFMRYLTDLADSSFVLSPHGHGMDCHRTWEALLVGSYPVVRQSSLDVLYADLPVVIVNDWAEIDEPFLFAQLAKLQTGSYKLEKLYFKYWEQLMKAKQGLIRNTV